MVFRTIIGKLIQAAMLLLGTTLLMFLLTLFSANSINIAEENMRGANMSGFAVTIDAFSQFLAFLENSLQGDFGFSPHYQQAPLEVIMKSLFTTLDFLLTSMIFIVILGFLFAYFVPKIPLESAVINDTRTAIAYFLWAILLLLISGIVNVSNSDISLSEGLYFWQSIMQGDRAGAMQLFDAMLLPLLAFIPPSAFHFACHIQKNNRTYRKKVYVTIQNKQFTIDRLLFICKKLLKLFLKKITYIFTYIIIIESIFQYKGIGFLTLEAIINADTALIRAILFMFIAIYMIFFIIDAGLNNQHHQQDNYG
ncbi:MAG: hypothetical protein K0U39_05890 [Alphaproteobacteria bacterium]|nr:hypothetical protein [Alphaproteobacteria bacterium]